MTTSADAPTRTFESVTVGDVLPSLSWGRITSLHLMRWSAAIENWHRIHYDQPFATGHDGLPDLLVNGSLKQHLLVQVVRNWVGASGWLWHMQFRFHGMDVVGDTLTVRATVSETRRLPDFGVAVVDLEIRNQRDEVSTSGIARAVLPYEAGPAVPYPFPRGLSW